MTAEAAFAGAFGARANDAAGTDVWARKTLASPTHDVTTTVRFKVDSRTTAMHMLRFRSVGNVPLVRVSINGSGRLVYRNEVAGVNHVSTTTPTNGVWHELSVRTFADGATGHVTVMLDGVRWPASISSRTSAPTRSAGSRSATRRTSTSTRRPTTTSW